MSKRKQTHILATIRTMLLATAGYSVLAGAAFAASISDTVRMAVETNPEVAAVRADRRAVDQELRQARAGYLPSLDFQADAGPQILDSPSTRRRGPGSSDTSERIRYGGQVSLSQMLFDGFATSSEVERQKSRIESASYRVNEAAEFIAVDAIEAHLEVLRNEEIVQRNIENVAAHERILSMVRRLEQSGGGGIADVRQTEARLANAQATLASSEGDLRDARSLYAAVVGTEAEALENTVPPLEVIPKSEMEAAQLASSSSPTVQIAAADVDVASNELRATRAGFFPRVDLELSARTDEDVDGTVGRTNEASALAVLRYNLYRGGADVAREREAFHRLNEARANLVRARRGAEQEARVSQTAYDVAVERTQRLRERAEAQRRTRDAYASQFEIGQRDLLDLLDSENELFIARVQLITAEYTEQFAVYRLLGVVGNLLPTLDIARPRETISVHRTPERVLTPGAIEERSRPLDDIRAEPRPLRGPDAGEPPRDALDAMDSYNPGGTSPAAAPPGASGEQRSNLMPQPQPGSSDPQDSLAALATIAPAAAPRREAGASTDPRAASSTTPGEPSGVSTVAQASRAAPERVETASEPPPQPASSPLSAQGPGPAQFDSFQSFWKSVTGGGN